MTEATPTRPRDGEPRDLDEIRDEIARTRAGLSATAEALAAKTDLGARIKGSIGGVGRRVRSLFHRSGGTR